MEDGQQPDCREVVELDGWRLLILVADDYSLTTDFELFDPAGTRYLGSAGTPEMIRRIIDTNPIEVPFWMSDLILLDELSKDSMVAAVRLLIERGEVTRALDLADPDETEDVDDPEGLQ